MQTLLLDGDLLVHRMCSALEKDTRFDDKYHILMTNADDVYNLIEDTITELEDQAGTNQVKIIFSDPDVNFRKDLSLEDYKSNRKDSRKPLAYWATKERLVENYDTLELPTLEADDTMGLISTKYPGEYCIWTLDKDLKQIPGSHLIDDEVIEISLKSGDDFFYQQILSGDVTDGYFGCPGIGNERAKRIVLTKTKVVKTRHILQSGKNKGQEVDRWEEVPCDDMWEVIVSHYLKAGATEADALYNARMARILRHGEYEKGKVKLWTPNQ